ncbi:MAG: ATP phosphoribosyltransferase [Desulfobacterales bacterium]|nr:ATP phosphoribosyltransferase [Desulfobacterales bacterium]
MPSFVNDGVTDLGVTGFDVVQESELEVENIMDLNFGGCKLIVAVKEETPYNCVNDIPDGVKIATSFPNVTKRFFEKAGKNVHVIEVSGATEVTPQLGLADVIVDITSSGSTLKVNKLKIIGEILSSQAVIIGKPGIKEQEKEKVRYVY